MNTSRFQSFTKASNISLRFFFYGLIIGFMGNLSALTDLLLHPDIPYFDEGHFIVGGMMALLTTILCVLLESHILRQPSNASTSTRLGPYPWILAAIWTILLGSSLAWAVIHQKQETLDVAMNEARTVYKKDLVYYRWATGTNGLLVPITNKTRPNPYLKHIPEYKVTTDSGKHLTLVNPEYMIRQVYEMQTAEYGALGHITSLDPIRSENAADPWETKALNAFEQGATEVWSVEEIGGDKYFRLMRPMITEVGCLKCHADQGYQVGDIRGGISVSVPMTLLLGIYRKDIFMLSLAHGALWILGLLGIFTGAYRITESLRKKEQAEARTQSIIDNMLEGLITLDEKGAIESLNAAASKMFGYKSSEVVGQNADLLLNFPKGSLADDSNRHALFSISGDAKGVPLELSGKRKDGTTFPMEISLSEMLLGPNRLFIAMVRDTTEEEARKAEALRAGQLAAIGELAAGVAHEINNPINGIINYTQILLDDAGDGGDEMARDIMDRIIKEGERIAVIVRNLLAFSRQKDEKVEEIQVREIIEDCVSLLAYQFDKDGIRLAVDVSADLPSLQGNPQQLHQVFLNLLTNARYALNQRYQGHDPGKRLEIRSQLVSLDGKDFVRTTVTDWGIGIPQDVIDRIFDTLFTTKPPGEGTGLGLSISKGFVRDNMGHLRMESVPGDHTTATVDLPAGPAQTLK